METIKDYNIYIERMRKSMEDKLFFMDFIGNKIDTLIDFGCSDGTLLYLFNEQIKGIELIGIDSDKNMLTKARKVLPNAILIQSDFPNVSCGKKLGTTALNLSSVLHEVVSYGTEEKFIQGLRNNKYDYIVVRDMIYNEDLEKLSKIEDADKVRKKANVYTLADFENHWGTIELEKNLIHYLLKYRYTENWEREVKENYLANSVPSIVNMIGPEYKLIWRKDYILPYIYKKVKEQFDIELTIPTHTQLIFKRLK